MVDLKSFFFAVIIHSYIIQIIRSDCPNGFFHQDASSCYRIGDTLATWTEGKAFCEAYGAHLLVIEDMEEQLLVENLIRGNGPAPNTFFFAGMTDAVIEGDWNWITNTTSTYKNWAEGEPNESIAHLPEDCLALITDNMNWYDANCDQRHHYICEASNTNTKVDPAVLIG